MTRERFSGMWRRTSDRWDRSRVPPAFDEGTTWEKVVQGERHIGARRRTIAQLEESFIVSEIFVLAESDFVGYWSSAVQVSPPSGAVWSGYTFRLGEGEETRFANEDPQKIPRFGSYPLLVSIPFEAGHLKAAALIDDRTGAEAEDTHLVSVGWDDAVNAQWWRVDQYHDGEPIASYWLDAQHRLMRSDWMGAVLTVVPGQAEAIGDLPIGHLFAEREQSSGGTEPEA